MTVVLSAAVTVTVKGLPPVTSPVLPATTALAPEIVGVATTVTEVVPKGTCMVTPPVTEVPLIVTVESEVSGEGWGAVDGSTMTKTG